MPSIVASAFREAVVAGLSDDHAELVDNARGGGPEYRETNRALMLGDRASREWAAAAIAHERPSAQNHFEHLGQLGKPEDASQDLHPAARAEHQAATSDEQRAVADAVAELADALSQVDTEAAIEGNRAVFEAVARAAAGVLLRAAEVLGGDEFVLEQANLVLAQLVALDEWRNQLGPRFEPPPAAAHRKDQHG